MTGRRLARALPLLLCTLSWACGSPPVATPEPPPRTLVALLPDADDGSVGAATVSNAQGEVELDAVGESTTVGVGQAPSAPARLSDADIQRLFGPALDALPPAPRHFSLFFVTGSDELVAESQALIPEMLRVVIAFPAPEVQVIGHTDSTGSFEVNLQLGQQRADAVRQLLIGAGLAPALVRAVSYGEADPLVPSGDGVAEPRNRRVEVVIR